MNYVDLLFRYLFCKDLSCDRMYDLFSTAEQYMVAHTSPPASVGYRIRWAVDFLLARTAAVRAAVPIAPACNTTAVFSTPTDFRAPVWDNN